MNGDSYRFKQSARRRRAAGAEQNQATEIVHPDTGEITATCSTTPLTICKGPRPGPFAYRCTTPSLACFYSATPAWTPTAVVKNGRMTLRELAEVIDLSSPSVTNRIGKLRDAGAIQGYTVIVDPKVSVSLSLRMCGCVPGPAE